MLIKGLIYEDFVNYKKTSMVVIFPYCSFKCDKECGRAVCQNSALAYAPIKEVPVKEIVERYMSNPISQALVCGGLEPFDSWEELQYLIMEFRYRSADDVVIYTGYTEEELKEKIRWLELYEPIVIKFGRYIPDDKQHFDEVLGVNLSSNNQYARRL